MADAKFAFPKLTGVNWQTWKVRLEMLLAREDLWHVVEKDVPDAANMSAMWKSEDRKAKATMILLLDDSQLPLVRNCVHAKDAFDALKSYHQKATRSIRVSLLKKICSTNLPDNGDVEKHLQEFDDIFDRLDAAGMKLDADTQICMLLRSLPASFDGLVTALDSRSDDDISMEVVKSKLVDEYNRQLERKGGSSKVEKAMRSDVRYGDSRPDKDSRTCHYCKKSGHIKRNCRKFLSSQKNGNSSRQDSDGRQRAKAAQGDVRGVAFAAGEEGSSSWVIDSGASAHMCKDKSFFGSLSEFVGGFITLADGKKTQILGEGSGVIHGVDGSGKVARIEVNDVKFVPGLSTNLISVAKLAQKNFRVNFDKSGCDIIDAEEEIVATGNRHGGLYYLRMAEASMAASEAVHKVNCQHQWHRRLGHRDWAAAERIIKEQLATGIKVSDCGLRLVCECCMEGKSARLPFPPVVDRKSSRVLDIVHTDLCGPMDNATPSGNRYVMTITDDYSRFTVTYLLKNKNEAAGNIRDYVRWVANIFGRKPLVVRSDGGGEFDNKELRAFYKSEGIQPQFTTPYSPQQNGVAERKNRSLTEMATCMLVDAGLEKRYWGEAMLTATYLQNRLPSRSIQTTPYQLWWGRKPDLSHLRVFGSQAYVHVPDTKRKKLDSKATKLTFIGYAMQQKGYRFVDLETDQVTISRDARFIELGNGTSSVEVTIPGTSKKPEEEIPLLPLKEEEEDPADDPAEESDPAPEDFVEADDEEEEEGATATVRRSERLNQGAKPKYLDDYQLDCVIGVAACAVEEPISVKEALAEPVWRKAMEEELEAHRINGTWKLVELPKGRKIIGSRWVYKTKKNEENRVVKFKARLVAQGYAQRFGVDFSEVFAPVTSQATFRTFLTVAAKHGMVVQHLDIKTAYLHGTLEEEVYMRQPPGFAKAGKKPLVCKLQRSIYGLRQSARCWNKKLHEVLVKTGFKAVAADPCLYIRDGGKAKVLLLVYVDDLLLASTDVTEIKKVGERLNAEFELTNLGEVRHFLGVEVRREDNVFNISLRNYIDSLLKAHGMAEARVAKSPMDPGYLKQTDPGKPFEDPTNYRSLVGGLLYLAVVARPDIAASAAILGRSFSAPSEADWTAAKRVLRFLKKTRNCQLQLGGAVDQPLVGYSDADWAGDAGSRRSTSGMVFQFGGGTISWASRRQSSVTLSSMEAEYVALSETCQEALWLRRLLHDLGELEDQPTVVMEDNQGCLAFVRSERTSRRSKHIDTRERFVQELCTKKKIELQYCSTDRMLADIMTKPLGPLKHREFCELLGLKEDR